MGIAIFEFALHHACFHNDDDSNNIEENYQEKPKDLQKRKKRNTTEVIRSHRLIFRGRHGK